jgi:hypothetical protein
MRNLPQLLSLKTFQLGVLTVSLLTYFGYATAAGTSKSSVKSSTLSSAKASAPVVLPYTPNIPKPLASIASPVQGLSGPSNTDKFLDGFKATQIPLPAKIPLEPLPQTQLYKAGSILSAAPSVLPKTQMLKPLVSNTKVTAPISLPKTIVDPMQSFLGVKDGPYVADLFGTKFERTTTSLAPKAPMPAQSTAYGSSIPNPQSLLVSKQETIYMNRDGENELRKVPQNLGNIASAGVSGVISAGKLLYDYGEPLLIGGAAVASMSPLPQAKILGGVTLLALGGSDDTSFPFSTNSASKGFKYVRDSKAISQPVIRSVELTKGATKSAVQTVVDVGKTLESSKKLPLDIKGNNVVTSRMGQLEESQSLKISVQDKLPSASAIEIESRIKEGTKILGPNISVSPQLQVGFHTNLVDDFLVESKFKLYPKVLDDGRLNPNWTPEPLLVKGQTRALFKSILPEENKVMTIKSFASDKGPSAADFVEVSFFSNVTEASFVANWTAEQFSNDIELQRMLFAPSEAVQAFDDTGKQGAVPIPGSFLLLALGLFAATFAIKLQNATATL